MHPKYILISKPNSAVLSDFGLPNLWRLLESDTNDWASSSSGTQHYPGLSPSEKVGYTAPEYILDDAGEMSPPADIYAFASVILAVRTGFATAWGTKGQLTREQFLSRRHPHAGITICSEKGIAAITRGIPPDPEDHPYLPEDDPLWPLLQRMWSQNPANRPTIYQVMKRVRLVISRRRGAAC